MRATRGGRTGSVVAVRGDIYNGVSSPAASNRPAPISVPAARRACNAGHFMPMLPNHAAVPVSLPSELVRRRPDILAAEADLHAATAEIGVATARLYPDVRLTADLTLSALSPEKMFSWDSTGYTLGAGVTGPVFHGGTLKANKRAAEDEARASLARYRQTVLAAFTQVSDVLSALANDDERLKAVALAQATAESNLKDARSNYALGGGPFVDIVTAQRRLNTVRRDRIDAEAQRTFDIVKLFTATAADWRTEQAAAR